MKLLFNHSFPVKNGIHRAAIATVIILLIPFIAMQFTDEVKWDLIDFIVMVILLFVMASLFVLICRKAPNYRLMVGICLVMTFLGIWAELAVGLLSNLIS